MLFSVEQAFLGRDEKRAPLKTPAWEATALAIYHRYTDLPIHRSTDLPIQRSNEL